MLHYTVKVAIIVLMLLLLCLHLYLDLKLHMNLITLTEGIKYIHLQLWLSRNSIVKGCHDFKSQGRILHE